eukprot:963873_1
MCFIHQMWDPTQISGKLAEFVRSALETHPDWKYVFWTDKDCLELVDSHAGDGLRQLFRALMWGTDRGDLCRSLILYEFGGVYADLDTLFLQNLASVLDGKEFPGSYERRIV